jgi:hypothetical protein
MPAGLWLNTLYEMIIIIPMKLMVFIGVSNSAVGLEI